MDDQLPDPDGVYQRLRHCLRVLEQPPHWSQPQTGAEPPPFPESGAAGEGQEAAVSLPGRCQGGGQAWERGVPCACIPLLVWYRASSGALCPTTPAWANTHGTQAGWRRLRAAPWCHHRATASAGASISSRSTGAVTTHCDGVVALPGRGGGSGSPGVSPGLPRCSRSPLGAEAAGGLSCHHLCQQRAAAGASQSWRPAPARDVCVCSGMSCLTRSCPHGCWATSLPGNH